MCSCRADHAVLQQLNNNTVNASVSSVSSAAASGRPPPVKSVARPVVVKPDPGSSTPKQPHQQSNDQQQQPSTSEHQVSVETDTDDMAGPGGKAGVTKRRRRIRNAKQQELNRLAQQRYRWA